MLFGKKKTLANTDFMRGLIDYHSHILPGVDDGVQTMDQSIAILQRYEQLGVAEVWLTPHIMEDIPNETEALKQKFQELCTKVEAIGINIKLHLAAEYMMDSLLEERLSVKDLLPIGTYDQLLVETSYFNPPMRMTEILNAVKGKGFYPVLAHPERYMYMGDKDYERLRKMDIRFQLNLGSLSGGYGRHVKKKALTMLKKGWYTYFGTDCHRMDMIDLILEAECPKTLSHNQ